VGPAVVAASSAKEQLTAKRKPAKSDLDDLLDGTLSSGGQGKGRGESARAPGSVADRAASKPASSDDLLSAFGRPSQRQPESEAAPKRSAEGGFAEPPPPSPAPRSTSAPALGPGANKAKSARLQKESNGRPVMDEEAPTAAPMAASSRSEEAAESDAESTAEPDPASPLMARAEGLMASRRWTEAAAAYRSLIARFPRHEQVPNWKRRLSVVESAARQAPSGRGFATPPPSK
jgi:hypothetical protein